MGNCKDCKHWRKEVDTNLESWNSCIQAAWVHSGGEVCSDGLAFHADADDDSGLQAGVVTGPNFGCIKFEEAMDPNELLIRLLNSIEDSDRDDVIDSLADLEEWIENGGNLPVIKLEKTGFKTIAEITPGRR